jgi:hypothetical protein
MPLLTGGAFFIDELDRLNLIQTLRCVRKLDELKKIVVNLYFRKC